MLTLRNKLKMDWFNQDFSRELYIEKQRGCSSQFVLLDEDDKDETKDDGYSLPPLVGADGTPQLIEFESKYTKEERRRIMDDMIGEGIERRTFWSTKYVVECASQCIFPYPGRDPLVFIPCLANSGHKYVCYFSSDLIVVFMFVRIYGLIRHLERYHEFTDMNSKKICRDKFGF